MATEIERKFLISDPSVLEGRTGRRLAQGYLPVSAPASVRIRIIEDENGTEARLTLKQGHSAAVRSEFEYPIPVSEAEVMLEVLCGEARVFKQRYVVTHACHTWEIDSFEADNAPLLLAEIELDTLDEDFVRPPWLGREVTDDVRFLNSHLCRHPLASWPNAERAAILSPEPPC